MNPTRTGRRWKPLAWVAAVLALAAVVGWGAVSWTTWAARGQAGVTRTADGRQPGLNAQPGVDLYPPGRRAPAPTLEGTTLDGEPFALTDYRGRIVVVNVWGSWCAPCRAETPHLVRLANEKADQGVRFVGIDTRDNTAAAKAFVRNLNVPYPSVEDLDGQVLLNFKDVVPVSVVPSTVVVDRQGRVAARIIGPITYASLKGLLDDEIAASKANR